MNLPTQSIYVTLRAARTYGAALDLRDEEARRELTGLLAGLAVRPLDDGRLRVRVRHGKQRKEVLVAYLVQEDDLWVVVDVHVRDRKGLLLELR